MKKILLAALVLFLIGTLTTQAANVSVNLVYDTVANTVSQVANAASGVFRASSFTATSTTATSTFSGAVQIGSVANSNALNITTAKQYGSALENTNDGAFNIENTANTSLGFQLYSNIGATMDSPLALIRSDNTASDDGLLWLLQDGTSGAAYNVKLQGPAPQIEWVEADQTSPAGKFEDGVNGDIRYIASRNSIDNSFENAFLFNRLANGGGFSVLGTGTSAFAGSLGVSGTTTLASTTIAGRVVLSSLTDGCLSTVSNILTSSGLPCGSGGGGSNQFTQVTGGLQTATTTDYLQAAYLIASSTTGTSSFFGGAIFRGNFDETSSVQSVQPGYANGTPRILFANGTPAQNWQIDNNGGSFRWYLPGETHMTLNKTTQGMFRNGLSINDNAGNIDTVIKGNGVSNLLYVKAAPGLVGIATSSPSALFTVAGDMRLTGRFADSASSTGAVGSVLTATANGTQWLATSSLGLGAGGGSGTVNSGNTNQIAFYNATGTAVSGTSTITIRNEQVGIGTTTPNSSLAIQSLVGVNPFQIASSSGAVLFNVFPTGNVAIGTTSTTSLDTNSARLLIDMGVSNPAQEAILVRGNVNDFLEGNIKNQSTGAAAQACWTSTTDTGSSTSGFVSMCSNNSNFNNPQPYNVGGQGDTSLMGLSTGDMYLVNGTASKSLSFLTGGVSTSTNNRMTITGAGLVGIGTTTPSDRLTVVVGNNQGIEVQSSNSGFIGYGKIGADRWRNQNDFTGAGTYEILYNNGAGGPAGTSLLTLTGTGSGIAGRMGLNNQAPGANLEIRSVEGQGNTVALLKIATSSVATSQLFSVFATSTLQRHSSALSYFQDNGARVQVGISGYYGRTDTLDTFVVSGTIRQHGWVTSNCPALTGAVAIVADGLTGCEGYSFYEDNADGTLTATAGSGYTYSRMAVGALTLAGSGVFVNGASAGWMRLGTSTPSYEARVRISNITAWATSTAAYIGYTNTASAGTAFEVEPTAGCYFTASSTQANYLAVSATGGARTFTDTTIASTTVAGTGGGQWYMMRVDADAAGCRFFMRESESAVLRQVAYHTTNLPTAIDLNTGVHIGRGAATLNPSIDIMTLDTQWRVMLPLN